MRAIHLINPAPAKDSETAKRYGFATKTWRHLHEKGVQPIVIETKKLPRSSKSIGDTRELPFLHDLFDYGCSLDADVIVFCNFDVIFAKNIVYEIEGALKANNAIYSRKKMLETIPTKELTLDEIRALPQVIWGTDFIAFKKDWWLRVKKYFPDVLLSCEGWDMVWCALADLSNPNPHVPNLTYHVEHDSFWKKPENRHANPGQAHNAKLLEKAYPKFQLLSMLKSFSRNEPVDLGYLKDLVINYRTTCGGDLLELLG